jgi:hypothetical protein
LIKYLRQKLTRKTVIVSPDVGGLKMASAYSQALGANLAIVAKQRTSATETEALYLIGEVEDFSRQDPEKAWRAEYLCRRRACGFGRCRDSAVAKFRNRGINYDEQHARSHGGWFYNHRALRL